jgi:hypothetical protein
MKSVYLAASLIALSSIANAETIVERGQYLVTTIGGCGNCHTSRQGGFLEGKVIPGTELSGGLELDEDVGHLSIPNITPDIQTGIDQPFDMSRAFAGGRKMPNGAITRNITSDPEDGLGKWTDEQIKVSITEGKRPDGTALNRIMAFDWYKGITQPDLDSIVAYLRTIPPQKTP